MIAQPPRRDGGRKVRVSVGTGTSGAGGALNQSPLDPLPSVAQPEPPVGAPGPAPPHPEIEADEEVRLAVVLYGGSSLCIYIKGVAPELLRLVRAAARATRGPEAAQGRRP